jgi:hypothetical protein
MTTRTLTALCLAAALLAAGATPAAEVPEGISDGVKVHGHWKIEVFEPDGTRVSSYEFDNALDPFAKGTLRYLLDSQMSHGGWAVALAGPNYDGPCDQSGSQGACVLQEAGVVYLNNPHSTNLVVSALPSSYDFQIMGSVVADYASSVAFVQTRTKVCSGGNTAPTACRTLATGFGENPFTATNLATPVPVLAGQIIQVTVTISFS